jgi:hypothetical protein
MGMNRLVCWDAGPLKPGDRRPELDPDARTERCDVAPGRLTLRFTL